MPVQQGKQPPGKLIRLPARREDDAAVMLMVLGMASRERVEINAIVCQQGHSVRCCKLELLNIGRTGPARLQRSQYCEPARSDQ